MKNFKRIKRIVLFTFIIISLNNCNDDNTPTNQASTTGFLWKATYQENTAYFFGTSHVGRQSFYPLSNTIYDAIKKSNKVYVELNPNDLKATSSMAISYYTDESQDINNLLTTSLRQ